MPIQTPQWSEVLCCSICCNPFAGKGSKRQPVSLLCGHIACRGCLLKLATTKCPFDQTPIKTSVADLPENIPIMRILGLRCDDDELQRRLDAVTDSPESGRTFRDCVEVLSLLATYLQKTPAENGLSVFSPSLSKPLVRRLVSLLSVQLAEGSGRNKGAKAARSVGERCLTELLLGHQNPHQITSNLWAAVRARGCQFLGPAMQEEVLRLVLLALSEGASISRKVLVMYIVQSLEKDFPQASKTSVGHVVQLLYRASCFHVIKRDGESSLMQLKEEFRAYDTLRREHDAQVIQVALEAGLRISPDQWSSLLYGDQLHKSHIQSIIDKLQTPQSFSQSLQELLIFLQRTGDPENLASIRPHVEILAAIDVQKDEDPKWPEFLQILRAAEYILAVTSSFCRGNFAPRHNYGRIEQQNRPQGETIVAEEDHHHIPHGYRYKTNMCRDVFKGIYTCPRGDNCTFAHSPEELEKYRSRNPTGELPEIPPRHNNSNSFVRGNPQRVVNGGAQQRRDEMMPDGFAFAYDNNPVRSPLYPGAIPPGMVMPIPPHLYGNDNMLPFPPDPNPYRIPQGNPYGPQFDRSRQPRQPTPPVRYAYVSPPMGHPAACLNVVDSRSATPLSTRCQFELLQVQMISPADGKQLYWYGPYPYPPGAQHATARMVSPEVLHLEVPLSSVMSRSPMAYANGMESDQMGFYSPTPYYPAEYHQYPPANVAYPNPYGNMQYEGEEEHSDDSTGRHSVEEPKTNGNESVGGRKDERRVERVSEPNGNRRENRQESADSELDGAAEKTSISVASIVLADDNSEGKEPYSNHAVATRSYSMPVFYRKPDSSAVGSQSHLNGKIPFPPGREKRLAVRCFSSAFDTIERRLAQLGGGDLAAKSRSKASDLDEFDCIDDIKLLPDMNLKLELNQLPNNSKRLHLIRQELDHRDKKYAKEDQGDDDQFVPFSDATANVSRYGPIARVPLGGRGSNSSLDNLTTAGGDTTTGRSGNTTEEAKVKIWCDRPRRL